MPDPTDAEAIANVVNILGIARVVSIEAGVSTDSALPVDGAANANAPGDNEGRTDDATGSN
jgi:hypothetical protein